MRETELRAVLLVKAVEEVDREGSVIPTADRLAASREAKRTTSERTEPTPTGAPGLPAAAQELLAARARPLLARIAARHPFVETVLALASGPAWMAWLPIIFGLFLGFVLSALDGTRRINVLAFPLLGLVAWNLFVYAALAWRGIRRRDSAPRTPLLPGFLAHAGAGFAARFIARSRAFDALLAEALGRFAREWAESAKPLIIARATRVFHLAAAAAGIGLIAGLYLRGIAFDYHAGWESTFLDAARAQALLAAIYGPAAWLTGIGIPDAAQLEAIRWQGAGGGERADRWIHLLAATAALYVVLPRLLLALAATVRVFRWSRRAPLPDSLFAYFRASFAGVDGTIERGTVLVSPYAYEVSNAALERLRAWLPSVIGATLSVDLRAPVAYGGEDEFLQVIADRGGGVADVVVLLFSLATTPEDENHGTFIAGVRDWLRDKRPDARARVVVDEGPYAARMDNDRVAQRREAWREFVAARGLKPDFVNLSR